MIFRTSSSIKSTLPKKDLYIKLKGQHFKVHQLDFEVMERYGMLKIIPHTEYNDERIYTLPITHLHLQDDVGGTTIKIKSKPRRIDIGGPKIALIFILFITLTGVIVYLSEMAQYYTAAYILMVLGVVFLFIFFYRMNNGYYDYIRKIKAWVKSQA